MFLACVIVVVSLAAPLLFRLAGPPNLWLGTASIALAVAGIVTMYSAVSSAHRRRADAAIRLRADISANGISFYRNPGAEGAEFFPKHHIERSWLFSGVLVIDTNAEHEKPGRHRLEFTKLASPRIQIMDAITALNNTETSSTVSSA